MRPRPADRTPHRPGCRVLKAAVVGWLLVFAGAVQAWTPHYRPNMVDLMETGLYWLQEYTGEYDPRDPASLVSIMEEHIGQYFDLTAMAYRTGGPYYRSLNLLARSHYQNRLRDRLFELLAREFGWFDRRPPRVTMLPFRRTGEYSYTANFVVKRPYTLPTRIRFHIGPTTLGLRIRAVTIDGIPVSTILRHH